MCVHVCVCVCVDSLFILCVDLKKAYDSIPRSALRYEWFTRLQSSSYCCMVQKHGQPRLRACEGCMASTIVVFAPCWE